MARHEIPEGYTIGLLASMPRSGTWRGHYFFEFLDLHLAGRSVLNTRMELEIYHALKVGKISVHCICPGFPELCHGPLREKWDALSFISEGFNYGYKKFVADNLQVFAPDLNSKIRIIYLFRNPLDQAVSYFRHSRHNRDRAWTTREEGANGAQIELTTPSEFLRGGGLESYIKQFVTFAALAPAFPQNILMVSYEEVMRGPERAFERMLGFWNFQLDSAERREAFQRALNSSSSASLKNVEAALNASLARDQTEPSESHMRGGEIGKWRRFLSQDDVTFAEARLGEFGLSLQRFALD